MARLAEHVLLVRAGREQSVAATKTYTGQLLMLYLLGYALGAPLPLDAVRRLAAHAEAALRMEARVAEIAERYTFIERGLVVARGLNYANALEFALKLMETCYVVAERFSAADLLHGPIAMIESAFPAFLFAPPGVTWQGLAEMLDKLQHLKADSLVITDESNAEAMGHGRRGICLPIDLADKGGVLPAEIWTPIPYIIPAQMFAALLAEQKGLDPDRPRTLTKVTRTL
jgi:glucosamine--fructose-6-phosphate aminotransferase (isomerizing)